MLKQALPFKKHCACVTLLCAAAALVSYVTEPSWAVLEDANERLDQELRRITSKLALTGEPAAGRVLPAANDPLAVLGRKLFFSTSLSGNNDTACATCHHPVLGGGDSLALPRGVDASRSRVVGPGRLLSKEGSDGPVLPRNAPTTFNVGLYDAVLLWDGSIESFGKTRGKNGDDGEGIRTPDTRHETLDPDAGRNLVAAQAKAPVVAAVEMKGSDKRSDVGYADREARKSLRDQIAERLASNPVWKAEFARAYGDDDPIGYGRIAHALGEFQRSQVFVRNPWAAYVKGDSSAISAAAKRGALLFFKPASEGGADCASCHSGDFFTDEKFYVIGVPQVGHGMGDGPTADDDYGRYRETKRPTEKFAFRTPTLLNVEVTGPYGHTGAYATLEGIVRHHLEIDASLQRYDRSQLEPTIKIPNLAQFRKEVLEVIAERKQEGLPVPVQRTLSGEEMADLLEFLKTLTDPCVKSAECLRPWISLVREDDPQNKLDLLDPVNGEGVPIYEAALKSR